MKKFLGAAVLVFAACIPIGVASGTAQGPHEAVGKAAIPPNAEAQAALRKQNVTRYRGTEIHPAPDAAGAMHELHGRIGRIFALNDPPPSPGRLAHFAWLDRPDLRINGWYGTIKSVVQEDDRTLVRVQVSPHIAGEIGAVVSTTASYLETYAVSDDGVHFLGGEPPRAVCRS